MNKTTHLLAALILLFTATVASAGGTESACNASARCHDGSTIWCAGNDLCEAKDASCPFTPGYVICDGSRTWCPSCPVVQQCELAGAYCTTDDDCHDYTIYCAYCTCEPAYKLINEDDPSEQRPPEGRCMCPIDA